MAYQNKTNEEWEQIKNEKNRQIAYFNSVNAAISLFGTFSDIDKSHLTEEDIRENVVKWRDWFYKEWAKWHQKETTIQPISDEISKKINEKWQEKYNADSEMDDINAGIPVVEE